MLLDVSWTVSTSTSCSYDVAVDVGGHGEVVALMAICCGVMVIVSATVPLIVVIL